jgi:predicted porin
MNNSLIKLFVPSALVVAAAFSVGSARAQSSVTLYGIADDGLSYSNNEGGKSNVKMVSGMPSGSRWGLTGKEDLGGGLSTIFTLENGFDLNSGALGQSGEIFGRQAYMGLKGNFGTVTLGRQYDLVVDYVQPLAANGTWGGAYFAHAEDVDNINDSFVVDRSIKFTSADYAGFQFSGMYSLGGVPGRYSQNRIWSVGAGYNRGPLRIGGAYLDINNPATAVMGNQNTPTFTNVIYGNYLAAATKQKIAALGASYNIGQLEVLGNVSGVVFKNGSANRDVSFGTAELGAGWRLTPATLVAVDYGYVTGKVDSTGQHPRYHQFNLFGSYALSKRTVAYAVAAYQLAAGDASQAQITGFGASTTNRQVALRVGMQHSF